MDTMKYFIYKKIKILRKEHKLRQEDLAEAIGVSESTVQKWEIGKIKPRRDNVKRMADYFNVPLSYFTDSNLGVKFENDKAGDIERKEFNRYILEHDANNEFDKMIEQVKAFYSDCDNLDKKDELRRVINSALQVAKVSRDSSMLRFVDRFITFFYTDLKMLAEMERDGDEYYKVASQTFSKGISEAKLVMQNTEDSIVMRGSSSSIKKQILGKLQDSLKFSSR